MKIEERAIANVTNFRDTCKRSAEQMGWDLKDTSYEVWDFTLSALKKSVDYDRLQKAFALACRILDDEMCCPYYVFDGIDWPECDGETGTCGDNGKWECWQKYFQERVDAEQVCRICGCTQDNACPGGCFWVKPDLCSACAENVLQDAYIGDMHCEVNWSYISRKGGSKMAKQCNGASCEDCTNWKKDVVYKHRTNFHYCGKLERFTDNTFYCSEHENEEELEDRLDADRFDSEYC